MNKDNRVLYNELEERIQPKSIPARIALYPFAFTAGTGTLAVDAIAIHPVRVIPEAWDDVYELYWKPRDIELLRKALFFPLSAILTPPSFLGDWLWRSLFDV